MSRDQTPSSRASQIGLSGLMSQLFGLAVLTAIFCGCGGTTLLGKIYDPEDQFRDYSADTVRIESLSGDWAAVVVPDAGGEWSYKKGEEVRIVGAGKHVDLGKDQFKVFAKYIWYKPCGSGDSVRCTRTFEGIGSKTDFEGKDQHLKRLELVSHECECGQKNSTNDQNNSDNPDPQ